ncbi:MAG TPA: hypothetical protein VI756_18245 [Blastocatellia bacterium]
MKTRAKTDTKPTQNDPRGQQLGVEGMAGRGMMEVVVGLLVAVILGSIFIHVVKMGISMYTLNSTTGDVAEHLNRARSIAMSENRKVAVFFDVAKNVYGIDLNGNGRLDPGETEDLPEGIGLAEDCSVVFLPSGNLPPKAKLPQITISNTHNSKNISVSSFGTVSIE